MRSTTIILAAALLVCSAPSAMAQDKGWFTESKLGNGLYDIRFPGGTAAEYYTELGLQSEGEINVIVQEGVDLIMLPTIALRNVTGMDVVEFPQRLHQGLYIQGSQNAGAIMGAPVEEVGAFTLVVTADADVLQAYASTIGLDQSARRFDLRFAGGTAIDFVEAIREAYPGANILAMPGLEGFVVPAVNLDGVTVDAALESIEGQEAMVDGAWAKVRLSDADIEGREERVFTISLERRERQLQTRVWSVSRIIALGASEQDLLSAIRAALDITELEATVRFHPETQVLMVRGDHEPLKVVESTLDEVERSAQSMVNERSLDNFWMIRQKLDERITALEQRLAGQADR